MAKEKILSVNEAVHKLQLFLFDGVCSERQLCAAGSLMSQSDYNDVVIERSISELCGYPLCNNHLPLEQPMKGRYRISLREHKVYDLQETYMYCSSGCLINSRAFAGSLQPERCLVTNPLKINEVLDLFGDSSSDESVLGKEGDLGLSDLKIQEIEDTKAVGELSKESWVGPSNAIEGYVPKDRSLKVKSSRLKQHDEGSKTGPPKPKKGPKVANEMDFTSVVTIGDPFNNLKSSCSPLVDDSGTKFRESKEGEANSKGMEDESNPSKTSPDPFQMLNGSLPQLDEPKGEVSGTTLSAISENISSSLGPGLSPCGTAPIESKREVGVEEITQSIGNKLKSSLKCSGGKKSVRKVSWADEGNIGNEENRNICSEKQMGKGLKDDHSSSKLNMEDDEVSARFASAEACAAALSQAAEAVASCESDASNAVMEAGIKILSHTHVADSQDSEDSVHEEELIRSEQPPGFAHFDLHDKMYYDSWYDKVPEGFSLDLSSFATMYMALFGWVTSSSLAYIYGRDVSAYEEFSMVNGREYPSKQVLSDGRSSEIKQTLASCLALALPGLAMDLRLPTPISSLEQGLGHLLETMSFLDALPPFRTKQWNVIILLFLDALSVSRLPALTGYMTSRKMLLHKVLDGAGISVEEYETMKDLFIPLGRLPEFSTQSGA